MDSNINSKIVNILCCVSNMEKCENRALINKAISFLELNKPIAKELAQLALAQMISSPSGDLLLHSLSVEEKNLCLALVQEWKDNEIRAKKAWDT